MKRPGLAADLLPNERQQDGYGSENVFSILETDSSLHHLSAKEQRQVHLYTVMASFLEPNSVDK